MIIERRWNLNINDMKFINLIWIHPYEKNTNDNKNNKSNRQN